MFKKEITNVGAKSKLKSSAQRSMKEQFGATYPLVGPYLDEIIPKKSQMETVKLGDPRVIIYVVNNVPIFYQHMNDDIVPHLKTVHKYPQCFPRVRVDRGAIRFVMSGATLMAPGLTSAGGRLPTSPNPTPATTTTTTTTVEGQEGTGDEKVQDGSSDDKAQDATEEDIYSGPDVEKGKVVVVDAEGKENACAVGPLMTGTKDIKESKKGQVMDQGHYLGDGLWKLEL